MSHIRLAEKGSSKEAVLSKLKSMKSGDADWHSGQLFGLIYEAGREVEELVKEAASTFMIENGLSPNTFPSLLKMENEVISMVLSLMEGDPRTVGCLTAGGTESKFMAIKAARDWARQEKPQVTQPQMVVPVTAHPAWNKAAHYLGIDIVMTPVDEGFRADVNAMRDAVNANTIILGATAVTYPHGMVDPISEIGSLAEENNLWLHVDGCLGGNIYELSARLKSAGWHAEAQHLPASLHMTVSPIHNTVVVRFLRDLKEAVVDLPTLDSTAVSEMAAIYGMIGTMTDRKAAREFALDYLDQLYRIEHDS